MKVLVACEYSARVRDAFRKNGHDAWSCDILDTEGDPQWHIKGDALEAVNAGWDMLIAFPPCTDLAAVGAPEWKAKQADGRQLKAAEFFKAFWNADVEKICIENPVGWMNTNWRKPDQYIQPFMFGDPYMKKTCLWLKTLPALKPTDEVDPTHYWCSSSAKTGKPMKAKARDGHSRSLTFPGIAQAMADQWGPVEHKEANSWKEAA